MFGMSVALLRLVLWSFFNIPMPDELRSRCISGGVAVRKGGVKFWFTHSSCRPW